MSSRTIQDFLKEGPEHMRPLFYLTTVVCHFMPLRYRARVGDQMSGLCYHHKRVGTRQLSDKIMAQYPSATVNANRCCILTTALHQNSRHSRYKEMN